MMKNTPYYVLIILIVLIMSSSFVNNAYTQSSSPIYSYNVNKGDSNTYVVTKTQRLGNNYFPDEFLLENQSFLRYNITEGVSFNVQVTAKNQTNNNVEQVFINVILNIPGKGTFKSPTEGSNGFIQPSFTNLTQAKFYYNIAYSQLINPSFTIKGGFIIISSTFTANNATSSITQEFSLSSGWLEQYSSNLSFTNGTTILEYTMQRQSSRPFNDILNNTFIVFGIITGGLGTFLVIIVVLNHKSKKKRLNNSSSVDVAIAKIDEIISGKK